ncbi:MAG TPA: hypothetical protein VI756_20915, partial [Blastocatellia bacterium]
MLTTLPPGKPRREKETWLGEIPSSALLTPSRCGARLLLICLMETVITSYQPCDEMPPSSTKTLPV